MFGLRIRGLVKFKKSLIRRKIGLVRHIPLSIFSPFLKHLETWKQHQKKKKSGIFEFFSTHKTPEHISIIFSHLKLWIAVARHNFKWEKIQINYLSEVKIWPLWSVRTTAGNPISLSIRSESVSIRYVVPVISTSCIYYWPFVCHNTKRYFRFRKRPLSTSLCIPMLDYCWTTVYDVWTILSQHRHAKAINSNCLREK